MLTLASCTWGLATAHGVGLLTEMYAIYMERYASLFRAVTQKWTIRRKYLWIIQSYQVYSQMTVHSAKEVVMALRLLC